MSKHACARRYPIELDFQAAQARDARLHLPAQAGAAVRWHTIGRLTPLVSGLTSAAGHNGRVWVDIESESGPHLEVRSTWFFRGGAEAGEAAKAHILKRALCSDFL